MPHLERRRSFQPRCESLDDRVLLSATTPTAQVTQGVLFVTGTEGADVIDVTVRPYRLGRQIIPIVRVSGTPRWFNGMRFSMVVVDARGGHDLVRVHDGGQALKSSWLDGGAGNDTIIGGSANDVLLGSYGDDVIVTVAGLDRVDGGPGQDVIDGIADPPPIPLPPPTPVEPPTTDPEPTSDPVPQPTNTPADQTPTPTSPSDPPASSMPVSISEQERVIVDRTNQARGEAGLAPLQVDGRLQQAARMHAENMARLNRLDHTLPETGTPTLSDRARAVGYELAMIGENIAFNFFTPSQAVDGWLASEGHRRNILTAEFTQLGVAMASNSFGQPYYVQVFGRPA